MSTIKKSLIIILAIIAFILMFPIKSNAEDFASKGSLKTRGQLIRGANLGQSIGIKCWGGDVANMSQFWPSSKLYCVQHTADSASGVFVVDAYVEITGDKAVGYYIPYNDRVRSGNRIVPKSGKTIQTRTRFAKSNIVLSYLIGQESYSKYYDCETWRGMTRPRAIHKYISNTWRSEVGNPIALYWYWNDAYDVGSNIKNRDEILAFINRAKAYANAKENTAGDMHCIPTISVTNNTISTASIRNVGPIKVTYNGRIGSVVVKDKDGKTISDSKIKLYYYSNGKKHYLTDKKKMLSGTNYYIENTSGKEIKTITINLKQNTVLTSKIWFLQRLDGAPAQRLITTEDGSKTVPGASVTINIKLKQNTALTIYKKDIDTKKPIDGAKFVIYNTTKKKYINGSNGSYSEVNINQAKKTPYTTQNGELELINLPIGNYQIYEIEAPLGYRLSDQNGYMKDTISKQNSWVVVPNGNVILKNLSSKKEVTVYNEAPPISIEGKVWVDSLDTKLNRYNNLYDGSSSNDKLLGGIAVRLVNSTSVIASTQTDSNGYYKFKDIKKSVVENAYIEFIYDSEKYVTVEPFVGSDNTKNSKAIEFTMTRDVTSTESEDGKRITYNVKSDRLDDNQLKGTTGKATTKRRINALMDYYDSNNYIVRNINLGLIERIQPSINNLETLDYVKVKMKGWTYTYKYGEDPSTNSPFVPTVNNQTGAKTFTASIYPSDIIRNEQVSDELKVYVIYKINVQNTETTNIDDVYVEYRLYLESLINTFDTNRYELAPTENPEDANSSQFKLWSVQNNTATYDLNSNENVFKEGLTPNEIKSTYIQFRVKDEALGKVLRRELTEGDIESAPTVAKIKGFHEYLRTDNLWSDRNDEDLSSWNITEYSESSNNSSTNNSNAGNNNQQNEGDVEVEEDIPELVMLEANITSKPRNNEYYQKGEVITYEVKVTNELDDDQTVVIADGNSTEKEKTVKLSGNNSEGSSATVVFSHTVTDEDVQKETYTMAAIAKIGDQEVTVSNEVIAKTSPISEDIKEEVKDVEVDLSKSSEQENKAVYDENEIIVYKVKVTNKGNVSQNVQVSCTNVDETESNDITLAPNGEEGSIVTVTFTHKVTHDDLVKGTVLNTAVIKADESETLSNELEIKTTEPKDIDKPQISQDTGEVYEGYQATPTQDSRMYFGARRNDYPETNSEGKKYYVHRSVSLEDTSSDLYIKLKLGEPRIVSGTVFEDIRTKESEDANTNLGNGILDDSEQNRASQVKVELLDQDRQTVSKLYKMNSDRQVVYKEGTNELPDAVTTTQVGGTYTFEGIVPGYYYLRFTYGDGTQKIMPANIDLTSKDYRSTIINTDDTSVIKDAMEAPEDQRIAKSEWYKTLGDKKYSTAVDDINQRKITNGYVYRDNDKVYDADGNEVTDIMNINAYTPMFGISIENDTKGQNEENAEVAHKNDFNAFNFGIIKQSVPRIVPTKEIKNVEFALQTGAAIVNADPTDKTSTYLTSLENVIKENGENGGSKNAKLEIDPTSIFGSTAEVEYQITLENKSPIEYIEEKESNEYGYYYKYGKTESNKIKKIKVTEVTDIMDSKYDLTTLPQNAPQVVTTSNGESNSGEIRFDPETTTITNPDGTTETKTSIKMTGWSELKTSEKSAITYKVSALVSSDKNNTSYDNDVKVTALSLDELTTLSSEYKWEKAHSVFTITPTFGQDRSHINLIVGVVSLVFAAIGIVLIKKKVL